MYYVFFSIYFLFALYGVVCFSSMLYKRLMHQKTDRKIVVVSVGEDDAEYVLRCAMAEYPDSEIAVVNTAETTECSTILNLLAKDYERVHILV